MLLLLASAALAEDCLPAATWIERAELDIVAGNGGRASLDAALGSMRCDGVTPAVLADWFRAEGVARALVDDAAGADRAFAAAKRLSATPLPPRFGSEMARRYEAALELDANTLEVDTNRDRLWVDTVRVTTLPLTVSVGDHYLEVRDWGGAPVHNAIVAVPAGPPLLVTTGLPEIPKPPRARGRPWLVASVASLVAGGAAFAASTRLLPEIEGATDYDAAAAANTRMHALSWGGVGLGGAAAVLLGVHFVVK